MWAAPASRPWPPRRATPSHCTPTHWTKRLPCPPTFSARIARNTQLFLQQEAGTISGVYKREAGEMSESIQRALAMTDAFEEADGRRPRILVAKMGQDGHDRGQKVIASAFADIGFDVDIGPLFATPEEAARQAVENDVHIVGVSSLAAGHLTLVPALKGALAAEGREDIMIVVGGVIPPQDFDALREAGAAAIFPPGTVIADAAIELLEDLNARLGYAQQAAE
jgi:methylmalonyl-CoA mutase